MEIETAPKLTDEYEGLACISALASPVTHEFNNFLNLVLLQVAVMQQQMPDGPREELAAVRRQGRSLAALVQKWQQYRQRCQPATRPVALNPAVEREADRLTGTLPLEVRLLVDLGSGLPPVTGTEAELGMLVRFLVSNAVAAFGGKAGSVTVRTSLDGDAVLLEVEDTGPPLAADLAAHLFDPQAPSRPGTNGLELSAVETLVRRRMQGRIDAVSLPQGGLLIQARLKPAAAPRQE